VRGSVGTRQETSRSDFSTCCIVSGIVFLALIGASTNKKKRRR